MLKTKILLFALVACAFEVHAQRGDETVKDLRADWLVTDGQEYRRFDDDPVRKIFFNLDAGAYRGDLLVISDVTPFAVFVNRKLVGERSGGSFRWSIDSLSHLYSTPLSVSVFQHDGVRSLATTVMGRVSVDPFSTLNPFPRQGNFFLDFSLIATLIVSVYMAILLRANSKLTFDYLNAMKLFSVQERDETLLASRITSRVNVLIYFFCCLYCALALLVVFHLTRDVIPVADHFPVRSTGEGFLQWAKLAVCVALLLVVKLSVVMLFSSLFNMRDKAAIQFFNFIRALLLATGLIVLISTMNFILHGQYGVLDSIWLKIGAWVMVLASAMMYLKLLASTRYHFFHLFSYLCASEIIPLVILLKILLY